MESGQPQASTMDSRPHSKVRVIACKPKARILPRVIAGPAYDLYSVTRGLRFGTMRLKARNSLLTTLTAPLWLSFLMGAIVTGIGQARHVEFDRVAAFAASGHQATKDETAQGQNDVAHLSSPGSAHVAASAAPVKQA
jgi:hypothetical protein